MEKRCPLMRQLGQNKRQSSIPRIDIEAKATTAITREILCLLPLQKKPQDQNPEA